MTIERFGVRFIVYISDTTREQCYVWDAALARSGVVPSGARSPFGHPNFGLFILKPLNPNSHHLPFPSPTSSFRIRPLLLCSSTAPAPNPCSPVPCLLPRRPSPWPLRRWPQGMRLTAATIGHGTWPRQGATRIHKKNRPDGFCMADEILYRFV